MKILITGGTGSIGSAIVDLLCQRKHEVYALGRSSESCKALEAAGAIPVLGDLESHDTWIEVCDYVDGVIHAGAVWGNEMGVIDRNVTMALLRRLSKSESPKPFVYTGGCWLYGETGNKIVTERSPLAPIDRFDFAVGTIQRVLFTSRVRGMVIHPAMVYEQDGGVFSTMVEDAKNHGHVRVIRSGDVRWPLIHRKDLAELYALMIEKGQRGDVFNGATHQGVAVEIISEAIASRFGARSEPVVVSVEEAASQLGGLELAQGFALDQQMSGDKARAHLGWQPKIDDVIVEILKKED